MSPGPLQLCFRLLVRPRGRPWASVCRTLLQAWMTSLAFPPLPVFALPFARRPQDDYRFGLLWEWNLYEAMTYSPYVAARLQTWTGALAAAWGGNRAGQLRAVEGCQT